MAASKSDGKPANWIQLLPWKGSRKPQNTWKSRLLPDSQCPSRLTVSQLVRKKHNCRIPTQVSARGTQLLGTKGITNRFYLLITAYGIEKGSEIILNATEERLDHWEYLPRAEREHGGLQLPFLTKGHLIVLYLFSMSVSGDSAVLEDPSLSIWQNVRWQQNKLEILTQSFVSWLCLSNSRDGEYIIFIFREVWSREMSSS